MEVVNREPRNNLNTIKKCLSAFVKFFLPVVLLYLLLSQTNPRSILRVLISVKPSLLVAAYSCFIVSLLSTSLRAKMVLNSPAAFSKFFQIQCLGAFWTNISPSKLGEISYPIIWSKKVNISLQQGALALILTRGIDYLLLISSYLVGIFFMWRKIDKITQQYITIFFLATISLSIFFIILLPFLTKYFKRIVNLLEEMKNQIKNLDLIVIILSFLIIGLRYLALYFFVASLGVKITILNLVLMSFFLFLSKFVQTFASLGTHEVAIVGALVVFGFDKSDAINLSFNVHILQLIPIIIFGIVAYIVDFEKKKQHA